VAAGFDAVEIHGAHGYLVGQFLSPYTNRRDDEYGGDPERRLRFPLEVIAAVRAAVGADVPVLYRLSADEHVDGGLTPADAAAIAPRLAAAGVGLLDDLRVGGLDRAADGDAPGLPGAARPRGPGPRLDPGERGRPHQRSARGRAPPGRGRRRLRDAGTRAARRPGLSAQEPGGREGEICPCVACLTCSDLLDRDEPVLCLANTRAGRERLYAICPAGRRERVVVAGAGPAGLGVGRVLAERGHRVTILAPGLRGHRL
jgi:NADPH-dependent 2,4-dienoyl-CoA reductase/sulfur reductase-like enzyme